MRVPMWYEYDNNRNNNNKNATYLAYINRIVPQADVSSTKDIDQLRDDVQRDMGSVEILVNNAGHMSLMSVRDGTTEQLDRMISLNLHSHFYVINSGFSFRFRNSH